MRLYIGWGTKEYIEGDMVVVDNRCYIIKKIMPGGYIDVVKAGWFRWAWWWIRRLFWRK